MIPLFFSSLIQIYMEIQQRAYLVLPWLSFGRDQHAISTRPRPDAHSMSVQIVSGVWGDRVNQGGKITISL